jgi:23S rRNA pseudouridine1911/1915/1917 synthase
MERKVIKVENILEPLRIDKYLSDVLKEYSREYIKVLCKNGFVKLNNKVIVEPDKKVYNGDEIEVTIPKREDFINVGQIEGLEIIYEDEDLLVINKPAFVKVHPAKKFDEEITLLDFLLKKFPSFKDNKWPLNRPFLVHRLDKETTGVLLISKTPKMQFSLSKQFQKREIRKVYRTIVAGKVLKKQIEVIAPIKKEKNFSKINFLGKEAKTEIKVLSSTEKYSYLEIYPKTGRTHQIRAHLSFIGYPIIGDVAYGGPKKVEDKDVPRVMLHAYSIEFFDYRRKIWRKFIAEFPLDFRFFLSFLSLD